MKTNMFGRIILSICLLLFIYVAAACSIDKNKSSKKSKDELEEIDGTLSNANINTFLDEAAAYIRFASEEETISLIENSEDKVCFTIEELTNTYGKISGLPSEGVIMKNENDMWIIYLTNGKYKIDGKEPPFSKKMVETGNKLSKTSC